jgi:hypothetical protein
MSDLIEDMVPESICNFCGKTELDVELLVMGPPSGHLSANICNECIEACIKILLNDGHVKLGFKPQFKRLKFRVKKNHCFYLGPFSEPFNTIYKDHIINIVQATSMTLSRADEVFGTQPIVNDIWEGINEAALIIADVTGRNPNVMYEIGMAHTIGKPVIIITQDINDVPFDLKHYRCIIYNYTPRGCKELEDKLKATISIVRKRRDL